MKLEILTKEGPLYRGDVTSVKLPGTKGSFEVLKNHAPIMSSLEDGQIRVITDGGETKYFDIKGGFAEVVQNKITVLAA